MSGVSGALGRSVKTAATLMEVPEAELELKEKILKAKMGAAHWNVQNLSSREVKTQLFSIFSNLVDFVSSLI